MPDQRDVAKIQLIHHCRQVVGESVEIVAAIRLARAAMTAPVERDAPCALLGQTEHRDLPPPGIHSPRSKKYDRFACAPVPAIKLGAVSSFKEFSALWLGNAGLRLHRIGGHPCGCG